MTEEIFVAFHRNQQCHLHGTKPQGEEVTVVVQCQLPKGSFDKILHENSLPIPVVEALLTVVYKAGHGPPCVCGDRFEKVDHVGVS